MSMPRASPPASEPTKTRRNQVFVAVRIIGRLMLLGLLPAAPDQNNTGLFFCSFGDGFELVEASANPPTGAGQEKSDTQLYVPCDVIG